MSKPLDPTTFDRAWAVKEAQGYDYGEDALEQVRLGWEMALEAAAQHLEQSDEFDVAADMIRAMKGTP